MIRAGASIRRAQPLDADALACVHVACWQATYRGLIPDPVIDGFTVERRTERWKAILAKREDGSATFVALIPGRGLVGFVSGGPSMDPLPDTPGQIYGLYLLPDCQGRGLGRRLMARAFAHLRERGDVPIQVRAVVGNTRAERAYRAWGGQDLGTANFAIDGNPLQETIFRYPTTDPLLGSGTGDGNREPGTGNREPGTGNREPGNN